ncbi:STE/STE20 protein kinase [Plasmodium inui San Antonio 1]|uniref:mitogen-activated protein kinase kinase n=1 Tax=Plasmodium inui San Antonio 1 TaxID=1237626 RepID=W7A558_9APIC|nr:STE/STE20 protein kinase [Plasmodium inui San Antonio 1]EUD66880.1 STE/STE20 protein kinase [Plasmodium inui San Antonio 1]
MFSVEAENTLGYVKKKTSKKFTHGEINRLDTDEAVKREGKRVHEVNHNDLRNNVPIMFVRGMKVGQKKCLMRGNGEDNPDEETALSEEAPPLRVNLTSQEADEGTHSTVTKEANVISKITPVGELLRSSSHEPAWDHNTFRRDKSAKRYSLPQRNITLDCEKKGKTNLLVSPLNESNNPFACYHKGCHRRGCYPDVPHQHFERHISKTVNLAKTKLKNCEGSNSEGGKFTNRNYESVEGSMYKDSPLGNTLVKRDVTHWDNSHFSLCRNSTDSPEAKLENDENEVLENEERTKGQETDVSTVKSAESVAEGATHGWIHEGENHHIGNLNRGGAETFDVVKVGNFHIGSNYSDDNILEYRNEEKNWEHSKVEGEACKGINNGSAINPVIVEGKSESIGSDIVSPEGGEMGGTEKEALTLNRHPIAQGGSTHADEKESKREQIHNAFRGDGTESQTLLSAHIEKNKMLHSPNGVKMRTDARTYRFVHHINRAEKVYSNVSTVNFLKNNVIFLRKRRRNNACKKGSNRRSCSIGSRNVNKEGDVKSKHLPKEHGVILHMRNTFLPVPKATSIFVEKNETNGKCPSGGRRGNSSNDREKGGIVCGGEKEPTSPHLEGTWKKETSSNRLSDESRLTMKQGGGHPLVVSGYIYDFNEGRSSGHEKVLSSGYSHKIHTLEHQSSPLNWKFGVIDGGKEDRLKEGRSSPHSIVNIDVEKKPCVAGEVGIKTDKTSWEKEKNGDNAWSGKEGKMLHFTSVKFGREGKQSNIAKGETIQYKLFHVDDMFRNTHLGEPKGGKEAKGGDRRTNEAYSSLHHCVVTANDEMTTRVEITQTVGQQHPVVRRSNHSDHIMNIIRESKNQQRNDGMRNGSMRSGHVRSNKNEFCLNGTNSGVMSIPNWEPRKNIQVNTNNQMYFTHFGGEDLTIEPFCDDKRDSEERFGQGGNNPPLKESLLDRINRSVFATNRKNEMDYSCIQSELENKKINEHHRRGRKKQSVNDVFPLKSGRTIYPLFTPIGKGNKMTNRKVFHIRNKSVYVLEAPLEMSPTVATNRKNDVHVNEFVKNKLLAEGGECNFLPNCTTQMREKSDVASSNGFYYDRMKGSSDPYVHNGNKSEDKWRPTLDNLLKNCYKERRNKTSGENYTNQNFIINRSRNNLKSQNKAFGISEERTSYALLPNGEGNYTQDHNKEDVLKGCDDGRSCVLGRADQSATINGSEIHVKRGEMGRTYFERAHSEYHLTMSEDSGNVKELTKQKTEEKLCDNNNNRIGEPADRFNFFHSEHDLFNGNTLRFYFSKGKNAVYSGIFKIRGEDGIFSIFKNFPFFWEGAKMSDEEGANQESISYECRYKAPLVFPPWGRKLRDVAETDAEVAKVAGGATGAAGAVDGGCTGKEDKNNENGATAVNSENGAREVHKIICGTSEAEEPVCAGFDDEATDAIGQMGSRARSSSNGRSGRNTCNEFVGGETSPGGGRQMSSLSNQNDEVNDAKGVTLTEENKFGLRRGDEERFEISADAAKDDITDAVCEMSVIEEQENLEEQKVALFGREQSDPFFCRKDGELGMANSVNLGCSEDRDLKRQKCDSTRSSNEMLQDFERIAETINFILDDTVEFFKKNLYVHNGYGSVKEYKEYTGWLGENTLGKWSRVYKINKVVCKGAHGVVFSAWRGEEGDDTGKQLEEKTEKDADMAEETQAGEGTTEVEGAAGDSIDQTNDKGRDEGSDKGRDESIDEGNDKDSDEGNDKESDLDSYDEENLVTLKIINLRYLSKKNSLRRIMKEVHFLQICHHPNIVKYHESFFWPPCYLVIVCEFLSGGTLFDLYKKCGRITEDVLVHILDDVLKGLKYLHNECPLCLVHRDIKPTNIVFSKSGVAKIVDFGSCEKVEDLKLHEIVGTLYYISPEILKREKYDCSADIWSLGITIYESVMCALPWKGKKDIEESIKQIVDSSPKINLCSGFSKQLCFFVESCLQNDAGKRAKVAHLLGHKFLTKKRLLRRKPSSIFEIRDILKVNNGKRKNNIFRNFFKNLFFFNDKNRRRRNKALNSKSCEPEMFYQKLKRENFDFFEIKLRDENSRSLGHFHVSGRSPGEPENEEDGKEEDKKGKEEPNVHDDGDAECSEGGVQRMKNLSSNYLDSKEDIAKQPGAA